jgi:putative modified peptide
MARNFSPEFADKLLDKLSKDDDFRSKFQADPRAAVESLGFVTPKEDQGVEGQDPCICLTGMAKNLASKEAIRAARDKLREQLTRKPFQFEVAV